MKKPSLLRFIQVLPRLSPYGEFSLKDLPGSGRRVDVLCRTLSACFDWGPTTWNKDNLELAAVINDEIALVFKNPPSDEIRGEKSWAKAIRSALKGNPPPFVERREVDLASFVQKAISSPNTETLALDEEGAVTDSVWALKPQEVTNIIVGDQKGYDEKAKRTLAKHSIYRISLGEISYLGSHCVAAMIALFERME